MSLIVLVLVMVLWRGKGRKMGVIRGGVFDLRGSWVGGWTRGEEGKRLRYICEISRDKYMVECKWGSGTCKKVHTTEQMRSK